MIDKDKIIKLGQLIDFKDLSESNLSKLSILLFLITITDGSSISMNTDEEWKVVCTDSEDRVLFGIKQDGTWVAYSNIDKLIDSVLAAYTSASNT